MSARAKGANRRPIMTADARAGLARLGALIPYSSAAESRDTLAALRFIAKLLAYEDSPRRAAMLAANRANVYKSRPLKTPEGKLGRQRKVAAQ